MMLSFICLGIVAAYIVIQVVLFWGVAAFKEDDKKPIADAELPLLSLLVAARNEEQHIVQCLQALNELNYPKNNIQILVGNDQSEDATAALVIAFIKDKPQFKLLNITHTLGNARGKANVLAHLAQKATGTIYAITDADIIVNQQWAKELVSHFTDDKLAIVSGLTMVHDKPIVAQLMGLDWLYFMGLLKGFDNIGMGCTAVGNNMAISKEAYTSVGGYEGLDFSVTEDYKLYREVRKKGWKTKNIITRNSLNISRPVTSFVQLMHQRKRWLMGAKELPLYWWILFGILGSFLPAIIILFFYQPLLAMQLYGIKWGIQSLFVLWLQYKLGMRQHFLLVLLYDVYANIIAIGTQIFFILPVKMQWKKRTY
jgi:cellulose synthase/poly-beta-1,6-N-acetylglucosamine synthase-like glycosyltransferase